jgi:cysteine desulfurase
LEPFKELERQGAQVDYLELNEKGQVTKEELKKKLKSNTVLVSIGAANSELGVVQDIRSLGFVIKEHKINKELLQILNIKTPVFHSDTGQLALYFSAQPNTLNVDLMTLDAGKLYAPRGTAALFLRWGTPLSGIFFGGSQEDGLRPGTESPALASAFATALEVVNAKQQIEFKRMLELKTYFTEKLKSIDGVLCNSCDFKKSLPNIVNISVVGLDSEYLQAFLDSKGIAVSTKSACIERATGEYS